MKILNWTLAIGWTLCLILNIITCCMSYIPSWVTLFCCLGLLVIDSWLNVWSSKHDTH